MRRRFMNTSNSVPLTFEALEDGLSISFSNEISYRINEGAWETLLEGENTEEVNKGSVISFQHSKSLCYDGNVGSFYINKKCNVYGACSSIIPKVFGDKFMGSGLFQYLFEGCSTIVDASRLELPATTLANQCYGGMFYKCTSLTAAPELPATTLAYSCYGHMFYGCTSLVNAPELPATTLADYCYSSMFENCTSLINAPELPAEELKTRCYMRMFCGCTRLKYVEIKALDISPIDCTNSWLYGVPSGGTIVMNKDANWKRVVGAGGRPYGWTVIYQ